MRRVDKLLEAAGAEKEGDEWHYPEYTKGCWGHPRHKLCYICKIRYPIKMTKMMRRVKK